MDDELKRIRLDTALAVDKVAPPLLFCRRPFYLALYSLAYALRLCLYILSSLSAWVREKQR